MTRILNIQYQNRTYENMVKTFKENSLKIIDENKKLNGFYAIRRIFQIGFMIKRGDLREMRRLKEMISSMQRVNIYKKGMFDNNEDFGDFEAEYDERMTYGVDQGDLDHTPMEILDCLQKSFACLFLFESCSMDLQDLFRLFKNTNEQIQALDVQRLSFFSPNLF